MKPSHEPKAEFIVISSASSLVQFYDTFHIVLS